MEDLPLEIFFYAARQSLVAWKWAVCVCAEFARWSITAVGIQRAQDLFVREDYAGGWTKTYVGGLLNDWKDSAAVRYQIGDMYTGPVYFHYKQGVIHRVGGPAIYNNGVSICVENGKITRANGPAVYCAGGLIAVRIWVTDGKIYRKNLAAAVKIEAEDQEESYECILTEYVFEDNKYKYSVENKTLSDTETVSTRNPAAIDSLLSWIQWGENCVSSHHKIFEKDGVIYKHICEGLLNLQ